MQDKTNSNEPISDGSENALKEVQPAVQITPLDRVTYHERKSQWVAELLKEQSSPESFYAQQAAQAQDADLYWLNLATSIANRYLKGWLKYCTAEGIKLDNSLPVRTQTSPKNKS